MADLRSRFLEDYAGGLLNIARQELSTTGEVLVQDGLTSEGTLFVEDGSGTKSGLKLGVSLAEVVDPTTETGIVNVRYADRTYAKIRDLKIFSTAIASAQAALSEATSISVSNLETAFQLIEDDLGSLEKNISQILENQDERINTFSEDQREVTDELFTISQGLTTRVQILEENFTALGDQVTEEFLKIPILEGNFNVFQNQVTQNVEEQDEKINVFIANQQSFREIQDEKINSFISSQANLINALILRIDALEGIVAGLSAPP